MKKQTMLILMTRILVEDSNSEYASFKGLFVKSYWNSEGLFIDLIGVPNSEPISWIWNNRKYLFDDGYPYTSINLKSDDNRPYAISVNLLDFSEEKFLEMEPKDQWLCNEYIWDDQSRFEPIAQQAVDDFFKTKESNEAAIVA